LCSDLARGVALTSRSSLGSPVLGWENGLLTIDLKWEVPDALNARRIDISFQSGRTAVAEDNRRDQESANAA
jgi:hypothetical protein